jgi:hypothetical protein
MRIEDSTPDALVVFLNRRYQLPLIATTLISPCCSPVRVNFKKGSIVRHVLIRWYLWRRWIYRRCRDSILVFQMRQEKRDCNVLQPRSARLGVRANENVGAAQRKRGAGCHCGRTGDRQEWHDWKAVAWFLLLHSWWRCRYGSFVHFGRAYLSERSFSRGYCEDVLYIQA